jgi:hypothetical protein
MTMEELHAQLAPEWDLGDSWRQRLRGALGHHAALCLVAPGTFDLVIRRVAGVSFRHTLTAAEVRHGLLLAYPDLPALFHLGSGPTWAREFSVAACTVDGEPLSLRVIYVPGPAPVGGHHHLNDGERLYAVAHGLAPWLRSEGAAPGDAVCFIPRPADGQFQLRLERSATEDAAVREANAEIKEAALAVLEAARTLLLPDELLRRLAGRLDLRHGPGVHLPAFVLGRDRRFVFDGVFYGLATLEPASFGRRVSSPYPRPEDYSPQWLMGQNFDQILRWIEAEAAGPGLVESAPEVRARGDPGSPDEVLSGVLAMRALVWDLLLDRSRLLNPPLRAASSRRPRRGNVILGPWLD